MKARISDSPGFARASRVELELLISWVPSMASLIQAVAGTALR